MTTVGGEEVKNVNITVYDSQGGKHVLSGAFVRTDTANTWDMVLSSITGDVAQLDTGNRRIEGIKFNASDGSYMGLDGTIGDTSKFAVTFANDPANPQTINISMGQSGATGRFDAVCRQFHRGSQRAGRLWCRPAFDCFGEQGRHTHRRIFQRREEKHLRLADCLVPEHIRSGKHRRQLLYPVGQLRRQRLPPRRLPAVPARCTAALLRNQMPTLLPSLST